MGIHKFFWSRDLQEQVSAARPERVRTASHNALSIRPRLVLVIVVLEVG